MPRVEFEKRRKGGQRGWSSGWLTQNREEGRALTYYVRTVEERRVINRAKKLLTAKKGGVR